MTDEVQAAAPAAEMPEDNAHLTPAERAVANGYKEPAAPSREERVLTVVHDLEHAILHNAPVTLAVLAEVKDLLGVGEEGAAAQSGTGTSASTEAEPAAPNAAPAAV